MLEIEPGFGVRSLDWGINSVSTGWRALRRRILTPDNSAVLLTKRGFFRKDDISRELLETVGTTFLTGYGYAVEARTPGDAERRLEAVPSRFRGFAYEGAAMGFAVLDGLTPGGPDRTLAFFAGRGAEHIYTGYVGVGWAMAKLPRFAWPEAEPFDPLLRWLMLDGYGFHQAFFRTRRWVHQRYRPRSLAWTGYADGYALRAVDQGVGRALWFVGGFDPAQVTRLIGTFDTARHSDLYSGAGLAAAYAGGATEDELRRFAADAGTHRGAVAQGAAFGAEARARGGIVLPHTELATEVLCGTDAAGAARITQDVKAGLPADGDVPAYETWRQRVATEFAVVGGVA